MENTHHDQYGHLPLCRATCDDVSYVEKYCHCDMHTQERRAQVAQSLGVLGWNQLSDVRFSRRVDDVQAVADHFEVLLVRESDGWNYTIVVGNEMRVASYVKFGRLDFCLAHLWRRVAVTFSSMASARRFLRAREQRFRSSSSIQPVLAA